MKHTYTVVGLGIFGSTIALELSRLGNDVIGIDLNPNLVSDIADRITQAVIADARDEKVLRDLGVHECNGVVIAIGEDIEANILATLIVKSMPWKNWVPTISFIPNMKWVCGLPAAWSTPRSWITSVLDTISLRSRCVPRSGWQGKTWMRCILRKTILNVC